MNKGEKKDYPSITKNNKGEYTEIILLCCDRNVRLNEKFANENKLSDRNIRNLQELYNQFFELKKELGNIYRNLPKIKRLGSRAKSIEFAIQRQWRFPENEKKHVHNFGLRHCSCNDALGYSKNCILHGDGIYLDT